jgi:cytochrome bd-type quinol oxidase subunit 1
MGPIRFGALPSLTHEGPWSPGRSVPTGYKLEQRSCRCHAQWASALDNQHGNVIQKRKALHVVNNGLIMVAMVVMLLYAYDKKNSPNDHRLSRLI